MGEKHDRQVLRVPPSSPDGGGNALACETALAPPEVRVFIRSSLLQYLKPRVCEFAAFAQL